MAPGLFMTDESYVLRTILGHLMMQLNGARGLSHYSTVRISKKQLQYVAQKHNMKVWPSIKQTPEGVELGFGDADCRD